MICPIYSLIFLFLKLARIGRYFINEQWLIIMQKMDWFSIVKIDGENKFSQKYEKA